MDNQARLKQPENRTLRRYRTGICVPQNLSQNHHKQHKPTYSKPIIPLNLRQLPHSLKNLDNLASQGSQTTFDEESFQDDKSCCCTGCTKYNRKITSLSHKFKPFRPKMHVMSELRKKLRHRFKTAAKVLMWMIKKSVQQRNQRLAEKTRKMMRLKTKVFEHSPLMPNNNNIHFSIDHQADQTREIEKPIIHSVQMKMRDIKHISKQSIQVYLQHKLHETDQIKESILLPKIHQQQQLQSVNRKYAKSKSKSFRTLNEDMESISLRKIFYQSQKSNNKSQFSSPYLQHGNQTYRPIIDNTLSSPMISHFKSASGEVLFQKQIKSHPKRSLGTLKEFVVK